MNFKECEESGQKLYAEFTKEIKKRLRNIINPEQFHLQQMF